MAGVVVRTAWGSDENYLTGMDWDIDRDRDLAVYDKPLLDADRPLAVYAAGSWLRVTHNDAPPPTAA